MERLKIAFADDDETLRLLASDTLPSFFSEHRVELYTGKSEEELVRIVQVRNPHILITDNNMPIEDGGANALRRIRASGIKTPAILTSGVIEQARTAAKGIENVYFLAKAYTTEQLKEMIKNVWPNYSVK